MPCNRGHDDAWEATGNWRECSACRRERQRQPRFRTTQNLARRDRRNLADEAKLRRLIDQWL